MKPILHAISAVLLLTLPSTLSAQIVLTADLGTISLEPDLGNQVRTFTIRNTGATPLNNIFGLTFVMQVGDGSAGPKIDSVNLSSGNSIFSGNVASEGNLGGTSWTVYYALEANSAVSLTPSAPATLLAEINFNTSGITVPGQWPVHLRNIVIEGATYSTEYIPGSGPSHPIDLVLNGEITVVPEPSQAAGITGILLGVLALARSLSRSQTARCG